MASFDFQARFDISSVVTISATEWEVIGDVFDNSMQNFMSSDILTDDVFFDENVADGICNRWKIISIVNIGTPNVNSIKLRCEYDESGDPAGAGLPIASQGMIFRPTNNLGLSQRATVGYAQVSETIKNAVRNSDMKRIDISGLIGAGDNPIKSYVVELSAKTGVGSAQRNITVSPAGWIISDGTDEAITDLNLVNMGVNDDDLVIYHNLNMIHADIKVNQLIDSDPFGNGFFVVEGDNAYSSARSEYNSGAGRAITLTNFCNYNTKLVLVITLISSY